MGQPAGEYQRRADLIPNLVRDGEGLCPAGADRSDDVTKARASATQHPAQCRGRSRRSGQGARVQRCAGQLGTSLGRAAGDFEAYPDLKSNQNFLDAAGPDRRHARTASTRRAATITRRCAAYNTTHPHLPRRDRRQDLLRRQAEGAVRGRGRRAGSAHGRLQRRAEVNRALRRPAGWRCSRWPRPLRRRLSRR